MSSRKPKSALPVEEQEPAQEQQPLHGGSFVRQPDGTLTLIEQTVLVVDDQPLVLGPGLLGTFDEATADDTGSTDPTAPNDPDAAPTEEA